VKIKVAYIISTFRSAGPTNQLLNIIRNLDADTFSPVIITLSPEPEDSLKPKFEALGIKIYTLNLSRFSGFLFGKKKLKRLLANIQPHILHSQGIRPDLMIGSMKMFPKISTLRNYPFDDNPAKFGRIRGGILARFHFNAIRKGKHFIACSKSLSDRFYKLHKLQIPYIQNGVDTQRFYPVSDQEKEKVRKKLALPSDKFICFTSGSLIQRKNISGLIYGFQEASLSNSLLVIAGDGPEMSNLKDIAGKDHSILFLGAIANMEEYLQVSDLFISTSFAEGLPNSVLEAMACGMPLLLSDIEPHKELIPFDPTYDLYFNASGSNQLSACLKQFPLKNREEISKQLVQHCLNNFSESVMSGNYQKTYKEILNVG
jgi:glycosyltransferase involved in cell wall biosynthesis